MDVDRRLPLRLGRNPWFLFCLVSVLGVESRALCMLGTCSTIDLRSQSVFNFFFSFETGSHLVPQVAFELAQADHGVAILLPPSPE